MGGANPFFTDHARHYTASTSHAQGSDLIRLVTLLNPRSGLRVLDVATGTGHTALALADAGAEVTGLDPTPAMLDEARGLARACGLADRVRFVEGVAEALPFPDATFDIVTCRRAAHHFPDIPLAVREMARVLRPGGSLGIADMCPEAEVQAMVNRLERLRDATHAAALDVTAWDDAVRGAGLDLAAQEISVEELTLPAWLAPVAPDGPEAEAVRQVVAGIPEAVRTRICGDGERWRKRRIVLVAIRPAGTTVGGPGR